MVTFHIQGLIDMVVLSSYKRFSFQGSSNSPKLNKDMVSNPKTQGGNSGGFSLSTCDRY